MKIDTRTVKNFLSDQELDTIEKHVLATDDIYLNYNPSKEDNDIEVFSGTYYLFKYYEEKNKIVKDILQPKFEAQFGKNLHIQQIHIFDSVDPYNIHSDVDSAGEFLPGHVHAWTFIIPLFDVDSHTIVFNEGSETKQPQHYIEATPPGESISIDATTYKKYFSHTPYNWFRWLTIEDIFKWDRGSLFAASRFKFHTSDNFLANGVKSKRALIAWTSLPTK
jgi:hypothetical protein